MPWGGLMTILYYYKGESVPGSGDFQLLSGEDFLQLNLTNLLLLGA